MHVHYRAVIDMGSNGIRFSISNCEPSTSRILPIVFERRCGISLYDAQYREGIKIPLPEQVIDESLHALIEFQRTCAGFGVLPEHIKLVATEATRKASNSELFLQRIEEATGWKADLLSKDQEAYLGAMGIASSLEGLCEGLAL